MSQDGEHIELNLEDTIEMRFMEGAILPPDLEVETIREGDGPVTAMRVTVRDPWLIEELTKWLDNIRSRMEESPHEGTPIDDAG